MLIKMMCFFVSCLFSPFALAGLLDSGYPDPWPVFRSISNYSSAMEEIARREESERRFYILAGLNLVILIAICFSSLKRKAFFR